MKPRRLHRATIFSMVTGSVVLIESATVMRRGGRGRPGGAGTPTYTQPAMPIYEYRCEKGHTFEVMQRMTDDPVEVCETCSAPVQRVFHPVAVHFKGSGFYNTDYGKRKRGATGSGGGESSSDSARPPATRRPTRPPRRARTLLPPLRRPAAPTDAVTPRQMGLLGFLAALWGASYLFIKYALEDFDPGFIVFARTAVASLFILAVIRMQGGEAAAALPAVRHRIWPALGLGALAITVPFLLITLGERHVPSGLTAVLIAPASLFVAMFAPLLDRSEVIGREQAGGLVVGLLGVALLVGIETVDALDEFLGALMILGASVCFALSASSSERVPRHAVDRGAPRSR